MSRSTAHLVIRQPRRVTAAAVIAALAGALIGTGSSIGAEAVPSGPLAVSLAAIADNDWLDRIDDASPTKTSLSAADYQYFTLGNGGTVLMPGPDGFTGLKPTTAPYAPALLNEQFWDKNTARFVPFQLQSGSIVSGSFQPLSTFSTMEQHWDLGGMKVTSSLDLGGGAGDTTRTGFVTPDGVLVVHVEHTVTTDFALRLNSLLPSSITRSVRTEGGQDVGLEMRTVDNATWGAAGIGVRADGTMVDYDATNGIISASVGPSTPLTLFIGLAGPAQSSPSLTPETEALDKALAADDYETEDVANGADWESFWLESAIDIPDDTLESRYILSAAIQAAHMHNVTIPTGMNGFRSSIYFGGQGLEYDLIFNQMSMLAANHVSTTRHITDWVMGCLPEARNIAERYNVEDNPDAGARFPWIVNWDCKQTRWAEFNGNSTQLFDTEAFPSVNAMRMALAQATSEGDTALLGEVKDAMEEVWQYEMNNAEMVADPDGGPDDKLLNSGFFYQWPPRSLMLTEGAVTEQAGLLWLATAMKQLGLDTGGIEPDDVYIPTAVSPVEGGRVVNGYPGAPTDGYGVSPMRLPFFFANGISPDDPLAYPTYSMVNSQNDINYTFNNGWAAVNAADMHQGAEALAHLTRMLAQNNGSSGHAVVLYDGLHFTEWPASGSGATPEVGADGTYMLGVQHMLMSEKVTRYGGSADDRRTLEIFPGLAPSWEAAGAAFDRLRTEDGLLVSAEYGDDEVSASLTNDGSTSVTKRVLLRIPSDARSVVEASARPVEAIVDGRFAVFTVTVAPSATVQLSIEPTAEDSWVTLDDTAGQVAYTGGGWGAASDISAYGGSVHFASTAGSTMTTTFEGTAVRLVGQRTELGGHFTVAIDGVTLPGTRTTYSVDRLSQAVLFERYGLNPGTHTLTIQSNGRQDAYSGSTFVAVDAVQVLGETDEVTVPIDASDSRVSVSVGTWTTAGATRRTDDANAQLALTFTGTQVAVRGSVGSDRGLFKVSVDGGPASVFDSYGWSDVANAVLWTSPALTEGSHVVRVTALGDHQLRSTADDIVISGFDVIRTKAERQCIDGSGPVRVSSLTPFSTWGAANLADGVLTSVPSSLGWHSGLGIYTDDAGECAIIDRGASTAIDSVTLYRADPGSPYANGLGFPVDYHVDISDDADFGTFTTVATVTGAPIPSSGDVTHTLAGTPSARYVRLVVTKAREIYSGQYAVALAELGITGATELAGLEGWYAALDEKDTRRVNVLVIGDSISESTWNPIADRYMNVLQDRINEEYGLPSAEFTYLPSYYATPVAPVDASVSWAGTLTPVNFGLGLRATETDSTGSSTFTFTGTRARIVFTQAPTAAIARIVVDGGAAVTVDTSAGSIVESGLVWDSGALSSGDHTIIVSRDASSAAGRKLWLDGAYVENGDDDSGVHFLDSAHNGYSTTQFSTNILAFRKAVARAADVSGGIDLIIWALGTNDLASGVTTADFKTRINSYVSAFETDFAFDGAQLFIAPPKSSVFSQGSWDTYVTAIHDLATANDGGFVDLGTLMPQPGDVDATGIYYDSVHPTADGYARMADILGPILDPEPYWFE